MLEKLRELSLRYESLETQLTDPAVYGDAGRLAAVNRELRELQPVVEAYRAYLAAERRREEAETLLHDPDFRELAQEELTQKKTDEPLPASAQVLLAAAGVAVCAVCGLATAGLGPFRKRK